MPVTLIVAVPVLPEQRLPAVPTHAGFGLGVMVMRLASSGAGETLIVAEAETVPVASWTEMPTAVRVVTLFAASTIVSLDTLEVTGNTLASVVKAR